jgi:hypothetical protein
MPKSQVGRVAMTYEQAPINLATLPTTDPARERGAQLLAF